MHIPFKSLKIFLTVVLFLVMHCASSQKFIDNFAITHFKLPIETTVHAILEDSYGFVWIGSTNGLWRYDGGNFKNYIKNENNKTSITDNNISCLFEDSQKTLWVGTYGGGLLKYNRNCDCFQQFIHDEQNPESLSFNEVKTIFETKRNQFYIGTDGGGLNLMNRQTNTFKAYKYDAGDPSSISHNNVLEIIEMSNGNLAIGTWIGLNIFDPRTQKFQRIYKSPKTGPQNHHGLELYNGNLITTLGGFSIYDEKHGFSALTISKGFAASVKKENKENYWFTRGNTLSITNSNLKIKQHINLNELFPAEKSFLLTRIFHSKKTGASWVLDGFGSFFHIEKKTTPFKAFFKENFRGQISKTDSNYWISQWESIFILNKETNELQKLDFRFNGRPYIATKRNNNVWVVDGEYYYEFTTSGDLIQQIEQNSWPFALIQTKEKALWIGEVLGAKNYKIASKNIIHFECDPNEPNGIGYFHKAATIFQDSKEQVWIGTEGDGLKRYLPESQEFVHYRHKIGDKTTLNNNFVLEIFEDNKHNLWIGTRAGLCRFDEVSKTFIPCENPVIKDKIVNSIEQDSDNNLWIGTLNGLIKYDHENDKIRVLNEEDGVLSHRIGVSSLHLETGELVFDTHKGLMIFNPKDVKESNSSPKLYISKLWVNNELITSNSKYISRNIEIENQVNLSYRDNKFEFEFQVINYNNNGRCKFAYKLDGYDTSWIQAHDNQKATYTNIPSGHYTFMVKASNEDGVWSDTIKEVGVSIKPPFWELIWVKILTLLVLTLIFVLIIWLVIKRERNRSKFEIEKERVLQFEEVAKMKLKFFTNISHELRTPLTLITSPLDKFVRENIKPNNKVLEMMYRNSSRLLELVNQILDFRKLESNQKLQITPQKDLSVFNNINASSLYWSKEKNIKYINEFPHNNHELYFDPDILEKIVTNLISNAFKYTSQEGRVELLVKLQDIDANQENQVVNGYMEINVIDNGSGIPVEYQEKVFERFYQLDENPDFGYSSGIGLSLTAELVKLHKGNIELKPGKEQGCHFKVQIPIGFNDYTNEYSTITGDLAEKINSDKTLVLIVEDNNDIRNYIHDELKEHYQVIEAVNGKKGLQLAIATLPDIIISDIMMPELDGIQFANQIKSNELTSHIPLLFLTAKSGVENKIVGLTTGAEDYIQKPFNISEIKLKIKNVLESRTQLLKKIGHENFTKYNSPNPETIDKYLEKVNLKIEEYLENSEFSIDQLCSELNIGRSQLYRKIQALTGKSIIEYINSYKLSIAMQLIKEGRYTLKEISYKIGYNDNRYFSRSFKKEFGNPPSFYVPKKKA
ncbi:two-component regulator propeller domain-containing protein [Tamlana sp. 2201CG12-4]|uniref:hybrid sensor histidine kinase/response regulator transcription factor n=1 Tax=Tamlana sp. 2201CG12-4 TaxID=3112582 RepID=UPI002DBF7FB9|nr:two-component regulator propeller domain-containing protein [Tamlana sp. 2201CG12-4]MEC3906543.1 two-component regulator propeller domain-containing protein [Tamlana sp. 2201CG12-4]